VKLLRQNATAGGGSLNDTSFLSRLENVLSHPFKAGFAGSMSIVFYIAAGIMLASLIVTLFLPELPLSRVSAVERNRADDAEVIDAATG
jgi:hypothetical protein